MSTSLASTTNGKASTAVVTLNTSAPNVPVRLAVPTQLTGEAVEAVSLAINGIIADAFALYLKTKNFHWHVSGVHFRDFHLLFDTQADAILEAIDPLAERVRKIGGTTLRSISHVSQLQSITDDNDAYVAPEQMILRLLNDNAAIAVKQRAVLELCEQMRDHPTSNLLEDVLDETERRIWFLFEISRDFSAPNGTNGNGTNGTSTNGNGTPANGKPTNGKPTNGKPVS